MHDYELSLSFVCGFVCMVIARNLKSCFLFGRLMPRFLSRSVNPGTLHPALQACYFPLTLWW